MKIVILKTLVKVYLRFELLEIIIIIQFIGAKHNLPDGIKLSVSDYFSLYKVLRKYINKFKMKE